MSLVRDHLIIPDWPAPLNVKALQTTRSGGVSVAPYDSMNLGMHVGDNALTVAENRHLLHSWVPSEPVWMEQVHGTQVIVAELAGCMIQADASISRMSNAVCAVMTADCLPIFLCDMAGSVVGVAHAGWRGLADGVIEETVAAMDVDPDKLMAWMGPAIGPDAFEVGEDVRTRFLWHDSAAQLAFNPISGHKYLADIYLLARQRLGALGVSHVFGGRHCTYTDSDRFFSYRRDGKTGRMASLIWLSST